MLPALTTTIPITMITIMRPRPTIITRLITIAAVGGVTAIDTATGDIDAANGELNDPMSAD